LIDSFFLETCAEYDVRLSGPGILQGLMEVCVGNTWIRWCGPLDVFPYRAAAVTCRQLGYPRVHCKTFMLIIYTLSRHVADDMCTERACYCSTLPWL